MTPAQMAARINRLEKLVGLQSRALAGMGDPAQAVAPGGVLPALDISSDDSDIQVFMNKRRDFYIYPFNVAALAAAGNFTGTIQIEADSNFVLQKLALTSDLAGGAVTESTQIVPLVTLLIQDTGSGRQLMQNPVPLPSFFGDGNLPFVLQNPRIFLRNTSIQLTFANYSAATAYNIRLALIGFKVYGTV